MPETSILQFSSFSPYQRESIQLRAQIYHSFFDCPTIQYMLHPSHVHYHQRHSRIIGDFYLNLNATSWCGTCWTATYWTGKKTLRGISNFVVGQTKIRKESHMLIGRLRILEWFDIRYITKLPFYMDESIKIGSLFRKDCTEKSILPVVNK